MDVSRSVENVLARCTSWPTMDIRECILYVHTNIMSAALCIVRVFLVSVIEISFYA